MTYPCVDAIEVEAVLAEAYALAASCTADLAEWQRARCRLLKYRVVATGDRDVLVIALSDTANRNRQLERPLDHFRAIPLPSTKVRP